MKDSLEKSMNISVSIMAHPSRSEHAMALYKKLHRMPFTCITPVFDDGNGEWATGEMSLRLHDSSDWHIILQDDAIIGKHFYENVVNALEALPRKSLVSFYLGKVRPLSNTIQYSFNRAMALEKSWLTYQTLLWGVGIAIPTEDINRLLKHVEGSQELYDRRIGSYYNDIGKPVFYTAVSLVDHNDSLPSLAGSAPSKEPRVAHRFSGDSLVDFNSKVQPI